MQGLGRVVGGMLIGSLFVLSGCLSPMALNRAVLEYDKTTNQVEAEMLLLNIARSRHRHPVHFTAVSSVAATFEFQANAGLTTGAFERPAVDVPTLGLGASVAEKPTITIVPIQGEEFTKRLLAPFDERRVAFLFQEGVEPAVILRLMVREIYFEGYGASGRVRNIPSEKEEYREFRRRVLHLSSLSLARNLYVGPLVYEETLPITISRDPTDSAVMRGLDKVLDALERGYRWTAKSEHDPYVLTRRVTGNIAITNYNPYLLSNEERMRLAREAARKPDNVILVDIRPDQPGGEYPLHGFLVVRSFHAILRFIAQGISADQEYHVEKDPRTGKITHNPPLTIAIEVTESRPTEAAFAVQYEGKWYSVRKAPRDLGVPQPWDEEAFRLLAQLYQMTVTELSRVPSPAITIAK